MNRRIKYIFILIIIVGIQINVLGAQSLSNFENQLTDLINQRNNLNNQLASQHADLKSQIEIINRLKTDKEKNESHLRTELSKSKSISTNIGVTESSISNINYRINQIKHILRNRYTQLIDSLQSVGRDLSDPQVNASFFRRLELTPEIKSFSFNPRKVNEANLYSGDSLEQAIIRNYLELAVAAIDSNLKMIRKTESQLAEQLRFARKTERFLDDIGDSPNFRITQPGETTGNEALLDGNRYTENNDKLIGASLSYTEIIYQVSPYLLSTSESRITANIEITNIDQYLNLVQKTIRYLKLYRESITDKLNQ